jgi:outer membrane protein assembly factor BamB
MKKYQWILLFILSPVFLLQTALAAIPQNPLVNGDSLYVSHNGIHKFNLVTLEQEWSALQGLQTFEPVMDNNLLYVGSSQGLYALDADTGEQVWHIEKARTIFSPSVAGQLYAGSLHGDLYSINPHSGKINWQQQFSGWIYSPVVLPDQDQLWTGGQVHQALAISIKDGRRLHTVMLDQESIFSPLYLQNQQVAFNLFNGKTTIINTDTAKVDGWLNGSTQPKNLSFDDRFIYRSGRDGSLSAFDRNSYRLQWQKSIVGQDLTMHPTRGGYFLMSDLDKMLVLFDPEKQTEVWRKQIPGSWFSPVQIDVKNIIYFNSANLQPNKLSAVKINVRPTK